MICLKHILFALFAALLTVPVHAAAGEDADRDGIPEVVEEKIGSPVDIPQDFTLVATSPNRGFTEEEASRHANDIVEVSACHVGDERLLFRVTFAQKPDFTGPTFIIYADMDNDLSTGRVDEHHSGVDVMIVFSGDRVSASIHNPSFTRDNTIPCAAIHGKSLFVSLDAPLRTSDGLVEVGLHLLSQRSGGTSDSTRHMVAKLPLVDGSAPELLKRRSDSLRSLADYRYYNDKVKYEKLSDKGLTYEQIAPETPVKFGRPRPTVPFSASRRPGRPGATRRERVNVNLLEEAGVARRDTPVTFGLPLPRSGLYDLASLRVLAPGGRELPAQFTATAFWPDDSLKWVLVDFQADLDAGQEADYVVEFEAAANHRPKLSSLKVDESSDAIHVDTGPLDIVIDKRRFNVFRRVSVNGKAAAVSDPGGVMLYDENGHLFKQSATPPRRVAVEQNGPQKLVIRAEGDYADDAGTTYMGYVTRLTFRPGSARVTVTHTHVNTYVKTEFTDVTSLVMPLVFPGGVKKAVSFTSEDGGKPKDLREWKTDAGGFCVAQWDEKTLALGDRKTGIGPGQYPGVARFEGPTTAATVALHEFWQRWPKGIEADEESLAIHLLPEQPGPDYGRDMPFWLMYPFVDGKYRFKWGMSFTTNITFDFSGEIALKQMHADANLPVVAVLPADWYATTEALGDMAAPHGGQFSDWDVYVAEAYRQHMLRKVTYREYGYLNYGDWYGERGRNWGNNEYDLAHGFFMQFARSGRRDYLRLALTAARHQADVDCVHAYPDPHYVGANHQHSIGHTGTWSQVPVQATWSHRYDGHTDARNGHTWTDGMMEAWYLVGDARVMEACLALGEHITWAMSPEFDRLGTHERSAGWSLAAILALYRGTGDPEYLAAAQRIVAVPLEEQKFDDGGAWPHVLPRDHAGGHYGAQGNNLFLMGVLLAGLKDYHEETGDPAVAKSLISGARWVTKSWDDDAGGWPYSASTTGEPYYTKVTPSLNMLIVEPVAYAGKLTGEEEFLRVARAAFAAVTRSDPPAIGKSVAQKMHFAPGTMGLLQQ